ncbi:MAG: sugar transferase [Ignavibacteria bacterium]|nr:sugar transferase [Ignavibacteria bacterium]
MKYPRYKYVFAFFDFIIIFFSFHIAEYVTAVYLNKRILVEENVLLTTVTFFAFSVVFILLFQNNYLYRINVFLTRAKHLTAIIKSFLYGILILIIFSFIIKFSLLLSSRVFVLCFFVFALSGITLMRIGFLRPFYMNFTKILHNSNVLIVGGGRPGRLLAEKLIFENFYGVRIIGFADDDVPKGAKIFKELECLGSTSDLEAIVKEKEIDEILIALDNISYENLMRLIDRANHLEKTVKLTSELFNIVPEKIVTDNYSGIPVVDVSPKVNHNLNYYYKRTFDYVASAVGLLILSPVFLVISILVKLSSPGEIFFRQTRIGKDGKPFTFYKFRSMYRNAENIQSREAFMKEFIRNQEKFTETSNKVVDEKLITPVGKFLRKTSLDELPQLYNVLKGDMSLVGPRPCLPYEYESYDEWHKRRHVVMPGCTGVWQVSGRSSVSFKDSVVLDIYYINNMTPWLDLQLILKTFPVMMFGRGAK